MWFIGVEVEQETSAPPPKKNPGSAPGKGFLTSGKGVLIKRVSVNRGRTTKPLNFDSTHSGLQAFFRYKKVSYQLSELSHLLPS